MVAVRWSSTVKNSTVQKCTAKSRLKETLRKALAVLTVSYSPAYSNRSDRKQHGTINCCITKVHDQYPLRIAWASLIS